MSSPATSHARTLRDGVSDVRLNFGESAGVDQRALIGSAREPIANT
jgi:hypothetical protein